MDHPFKRARQASSSTQLPHCVIAVFWEFIGAGHVDELADDRVAAGSLATGGISLVGCALTPATHRSHGRYTPRHEKTHHAPPVKGQET